MTAEKYPPLPAADYYDSQASPEDLPLYTAEQMRAYVDAAREQDRARAAAPTISTQYGDAEVRERSGKLLAVVTAGPHQPPMLGKLKELMHAAPQVAVGVSDERVEVACPFCGSQSIAMHPNDLATDGGNMGIPFGDCFFAHCDGCGAEGPPADNEPEARANWNRQSLAPATKPEAPATTVYVEARQCDECGHVGINDDNGTSACNTCYWSGPSPKEDHCPECNRDGVMTSACPKCGCRSTLIASADVPVSAPAEAPANEGDERQRFEALYVDRLGMRLEDYDFTLLTDGRYADDDVESAWWGYRQGIAAPAQGAAVPDAEPAIRWPKAREVARIGDMDPMGAMRVGFDSDNDVYVSVHDERGQGGIEFCNGGGGGGQSPKVRMALIALMCAIEDQNAEDPSRDWWAARQKGGV